MRPKGKGLFLEIFSICAPNHLNGWNNIVFAENCIRLVCEKLTIFLYGQDIVGDVILLVDRTIGRAYGTVCRLSSSVVCRL